MIFYFGIFIFLVLLRQNLIGRPRTRNQAYYFILLFLFLFSAFRLNVGCDWGGYLNQWNIQENSSIIIDLNRTEFFWWSSISLLQYLNFPYPWLNVFAALIFFLGIHRIAIRQIDPLGFLILLYPILIINMPMSGIRQGVAIGIMCLAFNAFTDKKIIWFIFLTILATQFHQSAIIFIFLLPLIYGKYSKRRIAFALILALPGIYVILNESNAGQVVDRYLDTGIDAIGGVFRVGLLSLTGMAFIVLLRKKWERTFSQTYKITTIFSLIMLLLLFVIPFSSVIGDRLGYYLIPIQAMILAGIPFLQIQKYRVIYSVAPYLIIGLTFLTWTLISWHFQKCYIPYNTWIFGFPENNLFGL